MFKGKKVTVIVVAAGRGSRFGGNLPKQFLKIGEKTVLESAIEPFQDHPAVDGIIVAASEEYLEHCKMLCSIAKIPYYKIKNYIMAITQKH